MGETGELLQSVFVEEFFFASELEDDQTASLLCNLPYESRSPSPLLPLYPTDIPCCPTDSESTTPSSSLLESEHWNDRGYQVCGVLNRHGKPCQRIGKCPFHPDSGGNGKTRRVVVVQSPSVKKGKFKKGWTKEEHIRFLEGLRIFGRAAWKKIAQVVGTRTPTQVQVHAHRFFLRQQQGDKNKKSIHDFNLDDLQRMERSQKKKKAAGRKVN